MDSSVSSSSACRSRWTREDVQRKIESSTVVVFAKGTPEQPRCGFSEQVMSALNGCGKPFEVVDVCEDRSIMPALKAYAGQEYVPLVFVDGKLVSSFETQGSVLQSGALKDQIERAFTPKR